MPSQLICRVEQQLPVAVLKVTGILDLLTTAAMQSAVRRCLSVDPDILLIDVGDLEIRDPAALRALTVVIDQTAEWPAAPIVFCAASGDTAKQLAGSPDGHVIRMADTCAAALTEADSTAKPSRVRVRLRPVPDACRQVRRVVTQACAAWHLTDLAATATLVATELVANVVRHAHTTMEFTMGLRAGRITLTVRDGSLRLPRPADPGVAEAGGRGLRLVRELTEAWGVLPVSDGKVVWTRLAAVACC